jgi:hypothetical protein
MIFIFLFIFLKKEEGGKEKKKNENEKGEDFKSLAGHHCIKYHYAIASRFMTVFFLSKLRRSNLLLT